VPERLLDHARDDAAVRALTDELLLQGFIHTLGGGHSRQE
jgi:hypothetical protein